MSNMAASASLTRNSLFLVLFFTAGILKAAESACTNPGILQGDWFSMERGGDINTLINDVMLENMFFKGNCYERWDDNSTLDANGNHDSLILYHSTESDCYQCYYMIYRTPNVFQYKQSACHSFQHGDPDPTIQLVCADIGIFTELYTFFRKALTKVNCKNTFEGIFQFTYEWDVGGGGICDSENSQIVACQEPGSPYVDNEVFTMNFGKCPEVQSSANQEIRFQCMGMWEDNTGNVWSGVADLGADVYRERFRCLLTRYDQEEGGNRLRYSMSWWADCSTLKSPYEGPIRLVLLPVIGGFQLAYTEPQCNFPVDFAGNWFHTSEYDVNAIINATHIYFNTKYDLYTFKETYFICLMSSGSRYLTLAVTVGKCEIDFVCWDMMPRHHSIIRWRISRPYRLTVVELSYPEPEMYMFRQACTWTSFTIDRTEIAWKYSTFLLNPPVPMPCPIRGRYRFTQEGPETELFKTRIRGITERPRHLIDCREYTSEWKSCDENPSKVMIDAEYCETVDHTGRPIGEYDIPDWELTCIGHWDEDWASYMVTWDPEDAMSPFRCWSYKRNDWRHITLSRSTDAACLPTMTRHTSDPVLGGSLALALTENERQYDDCAQYYAAGDPAQSTVDELVYQFSGCLPLWYSGVLLTIACSLSSLYSIVT